MWNFFVLRLRLFCFAFVARHRTALTIWFWKFLKMHSLHVIDVRRLREWRTCLTLTRIHFFSPPPVFLPQKWSRGFWALLNQTVLSMTEWSCWQNGPFGQNGPFYRTVRFDRTVWFDRTVLVDRTVLFDRTVPLTERYGFYLIKEYIENTIKKT